MNHKAIFALNPSVVTIRGDEAFDAQGNPVEFDPSAVEAWVDPEAYKDLRRAEYPSIVDQLDTLYHGGYDAWKASIKAVKDKYPKG
jgi:hypothetical protein